MNRTILFLLSLLICGRICAAEPELVSLPMQGSGKVVIKLMFRNGSICDPVGKEGLTQLTASLITDGSTTTRSTAQIAKTMYPWAARMGSFVDKEVCILTFEVPALYTESFTEIIKDVLFHPAFDQNDIDRIKSNQKNYVDEVIRQSSDEEYGKKYLEYVLFKGTPYQHLKQGTSARLASITREDVVNHYARYFTRNNVMVGVAGEIPEYFDLKFLETMKELSDSVPMIPQDINPVQRTGQNVTIISKKGALGSAISAGFRMDINRSSQKFAALMVANSWLGEHRKSYSRLYQKIREARSMNYGDYTYVEWYENGGGNMLPPAGTPRNLNYFSIWLRPVQTAKGLKSQYKELDSIEVGHAPFAMRMALREFNDLVEKGMNTKEFESTREFLRSYSKLYVEGMSKKLGYAMDSRFYGRIDWISELDDELSKLTLDQVNNLMKSFWSGGNMEWVIVTDESEVKSLYFALLENRYAPISYSNGLKSSLTPEILQEDEVVNNYPFKPLDVRVVESQNTFKGE
ncbi:MAG: M16 family metallopeptidase [Bacteroidota bacterium]